MDSKQQLITDLESVMSDKSENLISKTLERCIEILDCKNIGYMVGLSRFCAQSELLKNKENLPTYHNINHAAQAMISAAYLVKSEYEGKEKQKHHGLLLVLSMMVHDVGHPGHANKFDKELEWNSFNQFEKMASEYKDKIATKFPTNIWLGTMDSIKHIILGTEFSKEAGKNAKDYETEEIPNKKELKTLKILANEADILASSRMEFGYDLGRNLAKEVGVEQIGKAERRLGFLKHMISPLLNSMAAIKLELNKDVDSEIAFLNSLSKESLSKLDDLSAKEILVEFNKFSEGLVISSDKIKKI